MPVILDAISASTAVAAKVKKAMEQRGGGESMTNAESKAAFREMVLHLAKNDIKSYLRDARRKVADEAEDDSDVDDGIGIE